MKTRLASLKGFQQRLSVLQRKLEVLRNEQKANNINDPDASKLLQFASRKLFPKLKQLTDELAFNSAGKDIPELQQFSSVLLHEWKGGYWWKDYRSIVLGRSIVLAVGSNALKLPLAKRSEMAEIFGGRDSPSSRKRNPKVRT